ncbi:signal peptidase II [Candidatus Woesearchaeota archaeon]|nr:signal peptidase II [Candidatus Woesearchaeota archaeon]
MKAFIRNTALLLGLIILDQLLKLWAFSNQLHTDFGLFAFNLVRNTGASFGMLQGTNSILIWFSLIVLGIIMILAEKVTKKQALPVMLIVAGIIGNLIDRITRGFVVDFIDFKFWPVFNLADSCIVVGVIWLGIVIILEDYKEAKKSKKKVSRQVSKPRRR